MSERTHAEADALLRACLNTMRADLPGLTHDIDAYLSRPAPARDAGLREAAVALRAWEAWEADMILNAGNAWWDLQTRDQNIVLVEAQELRNKAILALAATAQE